MRRQLEIRMSETKRDKSNVKSLWKIFRIINRKYCRNKLKLDRIFMYDKQEGRQAVACYLSSDNRTGSIGILSNQSWRNVSMLFLHELSHAYERQILKVKSASAGRHNKRFWKTVDTFLDVLKKEGMTYK